MTNDFPIKLLEERINLFCRLLGRAKDQETAERHLRKIDELERERALLLQLPHSRDEATAQVAASGSLAS